MRNRALVLVGVGLCLLLIWVLVQTLEESDSAKDVPQGGPNRPELNVAELEAQVGGGERTSVLDAGGDRVVVSFVDSLSGRRISPDGISIEAPSELTLDEVEGEYFLGGEFNAGESVAAQFYYFLPGIGEKRDWMAEASLEWVDDRSIEVSIPYSSCIEYWVRSADSGAEIQGVRTRASHFDEDALDRFLQENSQDPQAGHPRAFESPVFLQVQTGNFGGVEWHHAQHVADSNGRGRLENLHCGPAYVEFFARGYSPHMQRVELRPGEVTVLAQELRPRPRVEGYVRDEHEEPVANAPVVIVVRSSPDIDLLSEGDRDLGFAVAQEFKDGWSEIKYAAVKSVRTDEAGWFGLEVPRGFGYGAFFVGESGYAESMKDVETTDLSVVFLDLKIDRTGGRVIKLLDPAGVGIPNATCQMTIRDDPWFRQYPEVKTSSEGDLFLPWASMDQEFALLINHESLVEGWDLKTVSKFQDAVYPRYENSK